MSVYTVQGLRDSGYQVRVTHLRRYNRYATDNTGQTYVVGSDFLGTHDGADPKFALPTGGVTMVEVTTPEGVTYSGTAECADNDAYNKKIGVKIALGRAMNFEKNLDKSQKINDVHSTKGFLSTIFGF
jgi:hypothetical protein